MEPYAEQWSYKRNLFARTKDFRERVETDLSDIKVNTKLIKSFFKAASVAYIYD